MLIQFNVTNYLSFKNESILSLDSNADKSHNEFLIPFGKDKILPSVAIYGANAAGKSNLYKAMNAAIMLIRESSSLQINQRLTRVKPFLFDESSKDEKTRFDFIYTFNNRKYEYGFVIDDKYIYEEYLYEYKTSKPTMIFERSNINDYKFTTQTKNQLSKIVDKNTPNKLFLSTATSWNSPLTRNAYLFFDESIDTFDSSNLEKKMFIELENSRLNHDSSLNTFMLKLLKQADLNISDFNYDKIEQGEQKIETSHTIICDGIKKEYLLDYNFESNGTKRLFAYGPVLKNAFEKGKTIVIDEIDNALHPILTKSLIEMFHNPNINKNGAQLIFNTHEISLLDLDLFRRDQIYFVEKDNATAISDLYSLDEFSPRKSENIQKGYLQGRYGAIPALNIGDIEW